MLFQPILALHIINFSSCQNYWGGGGAKRYICLPIFSLGVTAPPPPPPGSTPLDLLPLRHVVLGIWVRVAVRKPFPESVADPGGAKQERPPLILINYMLFLSRLVS